MGQQREPIGRIRGVGLAEAVQHEGRVEQLRSQVVRLGDRPFRRVARAGHVAIRLAEEREVRPGGGVTGVELRRPTGGVQRSADWPSASAATARARGPAGCQGSISTARRSHEVDSAQFAASAALIPLR